MLPHFIEKRVLGLNSKLTGKGNKQLFYWKNCKVYGKGLGQQRNEELGLGYREA